MIEISNIRFDTEKIISFACKTDCFEWELENDTSLITASDELSDLIEIYTDSESPYAFEIHFKGQKLGLEHDEYFSIYLNRYSMATAINSTVIHLASKETDNFGSLVSITPFTVRSVNTKLSISEFLEELVTFVNDKILTLQAKSKPIAL